MWSCVAHIDDLIHKRNEEIYDSGSHTATVRELRLTLAPLATATPDQQRNSFVRESGEMAEAKVVRQTRSSVAD